VKRIFICSFLFVLTSCGQSKSNSEKDGILIEALTNSGNANILGNWSLCSTITNNIVTQVNVCKTVSFNQNGTGTVCSPSADCEYFRWTKNKEAFTIIYKPAQISRTFLDSNYLATLTSENGAITLLIKHLKNGNSFYLSRYFRTP